MTKYHYVVTLYGQIVRTDGYTPKKILTLYDAIIELEKMEDRDFSEELYEEYKSLLAAVEKVDNMVGC